MKLQENTFAEYLLRGRSEERKVVRPPDPSGPSLGRDELREGKRAKLGHHLTSSRRVSPEVRRTQKKGEDRMG